MRELMLAPPEAPLGTIISRDPEVLFAHDPLPVIARHAGWKRNHALPVVDRDRRFLGALRYSTFRAIESELGQAAAGPDSDQTASALAELMLTRALASAGAAPAAPAPRPDPTSTSPQRSPTATALTIRFIATSFGRHCGAATTARATQAVCRRPMRVHARVFEPSATCASAARNAVSQPPATSFPSRNAYVKSARTRWPAVLHGV